MKKHLSASGTNRLLLLHKQVHDKRSIAESLEAYINRDRLAVCEVCVFFLYHNLWKYIYRFHSNISLKKITPPPFEELLSLLPMGVFSRDCSDTLCLCTWEGSGTVVCTPWYPVLHVQWSHVLGGLFIILSGVLHPQGGWPRVPNCYWDEGQVNHTV